MVRIFKGVAAAFDPFVLGENAQLVASLEWPRRGAHI